MRYILCTSNNTPIEEIIRQIVDHLAARTYLGQSEDTQLGTELKAQAGELADMIREGIYENKYGEEGSEESRNVFTVMQMLERGAWEFRAGDAGMASGIIPFTSTPRYRHESLPGVRAYAVELLNLGAKA